MSLETFVGESVFAQETRRFAEKVARSAQTVLLLGETGTGKDHLAKIIHDLGRPGKPFVTLDCGAIPEALVEAELFGHTRGAYTGATNEAEGLIRMAKGGTLLVNEIGNMSLAFQAKLLGVLEGRPFRPIGGGREWVLEARVIAATNADLDERMARGTFRSDLYYRLYGLPFVLAPLRERNEDIPFLLEAAMNGQSHRFAPGAVEELVRHQWPGNVREFIQTVQRAGTLIEDQIDQVQLVGLMKVQRARATLLSPETGRISSDGMPRLKEWQELYYRRLFEFCGGRTRRAAAVSGVSVRTIFNHFYRLGLKNPKEQVVGQ